MNKPKVSAKTKLLDAALYVIRAKGYSDTTVDDLCQAAGVTKGAFFHHFKSKEDLAVAAAAHFGEMAEQLFESAPYKTFGDPVERVLGYIDFRKTLTQGELPTITCLVGTMVQETYETSPAIREACEATICGHAETLEADIAAALKQSGAEGDPKSLALYTQAVIQGAFVLAKTKGSSEVAADCIDHLKHYFEMLFINGKAPSPKAVPPISPE